MLMPICALAILAGPAGTISTSSNPANADTVRLEVAATGNEARYRVREQLAKVNFPNDAVGATDRVSGGISLDADGRVVPEGSVITIDLRPLKSDKDRRDGYVQRRLLETEQFPTATLEVTALHGVATPLPTSGELDFTLDGILTIKGVSHPTTWKAHATATPTGYTGNASTEFTFEDFSLTKPRMSFILSVADKITLEYDFSLVRSTR